MGIITTGFCGDLLAREGTERDESESMTVRRMRVPRLTSPPNLPLFESMNRRGRSQVDSPVREESPTWPPLDLSSRLGP